MSLPSQVPVVVFLTRFQPGGTERQMIELIRRLGPRFLVHVACFHREGAWLSRLDGCAASIVEFPIDGFARARTVVQMLAFARWCRRHRIAVVQTCDLYANIFGLPAAAMAGVPVRIGSRRELNPDKSAAKIRLQRQAYRFATKVVANSPAAQALLEHEGLSRASIVVIPNGVEPFTRGTSEASRRPRRVITVANLRSEKGHETLLAAAALLVPHHSELRFLVVGDGPRRAALEAAAASAGLRGHVEFLGHREDVRALLETSDVFVLPSRSEAFPNSVLEAMAAGLPVVASAVGGLLNLVEHGRTGILLPPDDPDRLASALEALLSDPNRLAAYGAAAQREVSERYTFERMVAAFEELYMSALPTQTGVEAAHRAEAART